MNTKDLAMTFVALMEQFLDDNVHQVQLTDDRGGTGCWIVVFKDGKKNSSFHVPPRHPIGAEKS